MPVDRHHQIIENEMFSFQQQRPEILWSHVMYKGGKTQAARRRREEREIWIFSRDQSIKGRTAGSQCTS